MWVLLAPPASVFALFPRPAGWICLGPLELVREWPLVPSVSMVWLAAHPRGASPCFPPSLASSQQAWAWKADMAHPRDLSCARPWLLALHGSLALVHTGATKQNACWDVQRDTGSIHQHTDFESFRQSRSAG